MASTLFGGQKFEQKKYAPVSHYQALITLAEELKVPLTQIARLGEQARSEPLPETLEAIELTAQSALTLVDGLLLSLRLCTVEEPRLQPVSLDVVLQETAHALHDYAQERNCQLQLHISTRSPIVVADPAVLQAALASLGLMFIEAGSQQRATSVVMLAAHRSRWGMVTGLYSDQQGLSSDLYRRARQLFGQAARPLSQFAATSGAGVVIADTLLQSMSSQLRVSYHQKQTGLAATLLPSQQLHLV